MPANCSGEMDIIQFGVANGICQILILMPGKKALKDLICFLFWDRDEKWFLGAETDRPLTEAVVNFIRDYDQEKPCSWR
jgi:hypothetical protein